MAMQPIVYEDSLDMTYEQRLYMQSQSMISGNNNNMSHIIPNQVINFNNQSY